MNGWPTSRARSSDGCWSRRASATSPPKKCTWASRARQSACGSCPYDRRCAGRFSGRYRRPPPPGDGGPRQLAAPVRRHAPHEVALDGQDVVGRRRGRAAAAPWSRAASTSPRDSTAIASARSSGGSRVGGRGSRPGSNAWSSATAQPGRARNPRRRPAVRAARPAAPAPGLPGRRVRQRTGRSPARGRAGARRPRRRAAAGRRARRARTRRPPRPGARGVQMSADAPGDGVRLVGVDVRQRPGERPVVPPALRWRQRPVRDLAKLVVAEVVGVGAGRRGAVAAATARRGRG